MKKVFLNKWLIYTMIVLALGIIGFFLYPKIMEKVMINRLEKKVQMTLNYLDHQNNDFDEIKHYLTENTTNDRFQGIEIVLNKYLSNVLENTWALNDELDNQKALFIEKKEDLVRDLEDLRLKKEKINAIKENYLNIINQDNYSKTLQDNEDIILYRDLISNINLNYYLEKIDNYLKNIADDYQVLEYLNQNKNTWNVHGEKIEFLKRKNYDAFVKLDNNRIDYELVKDTTGPVINASNITITKGSKIDLKSKFKCVDAVDDNVTCQISGTYDTNKVGTYKINIQALDTNMNKTSKTINLIVKEKVVNKKPYYIEVIRNHNVVIVYGLDSNNEYKKIVKVFACSVGVNGKTPTGTFKTSDKSSWGWLSGNVYGQFYTRITGNILFHSVPYYKKAKDQLEWEEYNKLGTAASKGCVRLTVRDVKWIYNNCPKGTTVKIYDGFLPTGVSKPTITKIDGTSPNRGWDPTDPDKNNPWRKAG